MPDSDECYKENEASQWSECNGDDEGATSAWVSREDLSGQVTSEQKSELSERGWT